MKILAIEQSILTDTESALQDLVCYPDSSLLRNNDNFYIPNFSKHVSASIGVYVCIHKIGKHIHYKYIHRYYNACGIAINFIASDYKELLQKQGLQTDTARGFDHSFAISSPIQIAELPFADCNFTCTYNSQTYTIQGQEIEAHLHNSFARISEFYTIKIGDIFFLSLWHIPMVTIGDIFECHIISKHVLHCHVQ